MNYRIRRISPCNPNGQLVATSERGFRPDGRKEIRYPIRVSPEPEREYVENIIDTLAECEL